MPAAVFNTAYCQSPGRSSVQDIRNYLYSKGLNYPIIELPYYSPTKTLTASKTTTPSKTVTVIPVLPTDWNSGIVPAKFKPVKGTICWGVSVAGKSKVAVQFKIDYLYPIEIVDGGCALKPNYKLADIVSYLRRNKDSSFTGIVLP
jgi:asparagine N-glycosylation enzyme membrane subunit Stt3